MSTNLFRRIFEGINFKSKLASSASVSGDLENVNNKLQFHNGTSVKPVITEHVVDTSLVGPFADDSTVPSSKAVKTALDAKPDADKLIDTVTKIIDFTDNTKVIKFDVAGTTGTSTTITSSQTVDRVLTLPDATGNIATETYADQTAIKYSIVLS